MFATFTPPPRHDSRAREYRFVAVDVTRFKGSGIKRRRKRTTTAPLQQRASSPQNPNVHILDRLRSTEIDETEQIAFDALDSSAPMKGLYTTPVVPLDADLVVSPGAFLESRAGTPVGVPKGPVQSSTPTVDNTLHSPSRHDHSAMLNPPHWDGHMNGDSLLNKLAQPSPPPSAASPIQSIQSNYAPDPIKKLLARPGAIATPSSTSQRKRSYKSNFNHNEPAANDQQGSPHAPKEQEVIRPSTPPPSVTRSTSPIVLIYRSESVNSSKPKVTRSTPTRVRSSGLRPGYDRRCRAQEAQGNICGLGRPLAPHPSSLGVSTYPVHLRLLRHCKQLSAQETQTRKKGLNPSRLLKQVITWTKHDDTRLLQLRDESELSWQRISGGYFIGVDQAWLH
ncbi:hypothetical protein LTR74_018494, partial [Friedmanniomyces endolithicus]